MRILSKSIAAVWYRGAICVWGRVRRDSMRSKRETAVSLGSVGWVRYWIVCHCLRMRRVWAAEWTQEWMMSHGASSGRPR